MKKVRLIFASHCKLSLSFSHTKQFSLISVNFRQKFDIITVVDKFQHSGRWFRDVAVYLQNMHRSRSLSFIDPLFFTLCIFFLSLFFPVNKFFPFIRGDFSLFGAIKLESCEKMLNFWDSWHSRETDVLSGQKC